MFDPLLVQMKSLYTMPEANFEFVGALLRPMAEGMKEMIKAGETRLMDGIIQAAKERWSTARERGKNFRGDPKRK
jgi:hypothetical protein